MSEPDLRAYYSRAAAGFGEQVAIIGDEEWDLPTPCADWIIKAVVAHVVVGEAQIPDLINGHLQGNLDVDASVLGHDPMSVWRGTAIGALEAVAVTDLDLVVDHLLGPLPLSQAVGFRITENLVHAWDIATARGVAHRLDEELTRWCLDFWVPLVDRLGDSDAFGPMVEPVDDSPGARLLALLGRVV